MCTCNGEQHIKAQLNSFLAQTHTAWSLLVSDDGSTDRTLDIIREFADTHANRHPVQIMHGPQQGAAANYLTALSHPQLQGHVVALSDQDDVWLAGKLARALRRLQSAGALDPNAAPTLYGARSFHTDATLKTIGVSGRWRRPAHLANALCQNIVSGHSAVLNQQAVQFLRETKELSSAAMHDWVIYQLITAAPNGRVVVDDLPVVLYRQHDGNTVGFRQGLAASVKRIIMVFGRTFGGWFNTQFEVLNANIDRLSPEAQAAIADLKRNKRAIGLSRPLAFRRIGIYRQSGLGTVCIYLAACLGRL